MPILRNQPENALPAKPPSRAVVVILVILLALIAAGSAYAWSSRYAKKAVKKSVAATTTAQINIPALVEQISKHVPVNRAETPLVAIVTDVNAAKAQSPAFYKKAENGDQLAVWSDQAILYSPKKDEIESVLVFQASTTSGSASDTLAAEHATVEIRNGSGVTGLTAPLAEMLRAQGLTVTKVTTTRVKQTYAFTLVTNESARNLPKSAQILAKYGSAVASSTLANEAPVAADFLIILGKNDVAKYQK